MTDYRQIRVGTVVTVEDTARGIVVTGRVFKDLDGYRRVCGHHEGTRYDPAAEFTRNADGSYHECDAINVQRDASGYFPGWVSVHKIGR